MSRRLLHYAKVPLEIDALREIPQGMPHTPFDKPSGLWLSVDDAWRQWCEQEGGVSFCGERFVYEIYLHETAKLFIVDSPISLRRMRNRYGVAARIYVDAGMDQSRRAIDWRSVACDYDGIVCDPYLWECRLLEHSNWYYGVDVASACIWNPRAIERIEPLGTVTFQSGDSCDESL